MPLSRIYKVLKLISRLLYAMRENKIEQSEDHLS